MARTGWTHRGDAARGLDGRNRAAGLPQSVPEHYERGSEDVRINSLRGRDVIGERSSERREKVVDGWEGRALSGGLDSQVSR